MAITIKCTWFRINSIDSSMLLLLTSDRPGMVRNWATVTFLHEEYYTAHSQTSLNASGPRAHSPMVTTVESRMPCYIL